MSIVFTGLLGKGKEELLQLHAELLKKLQAHPDDKSLKEELDVVEKELSELVE